MINKVTKILAIIALTGWMGVANATLIFDFSWDSSNGKISGEILGLTNEVGPQGATGVVLTSLDGNSVSVDVVKDAGWIVDSNNFQVLNNKIVFAMFESTLFKQVTYSFNDVRSFEGNYFGDAYLKFVDGAENILISALKDDVTNELSISFVNRVTVPEPNSVLLVSLGLAGLSFARYRKQS
ncbi:PEP-CTERM sorting domain-containing protein [Paraglaciecola sp. MB-3u-78]|uniref:PEP-CTERM sorting domain-containing protein n=1 Tax=Paraglaciecola sp. MB-3u-78 TaxID=2058332 RepID=UPI000C33C9B9|nr:PEP-CTERM sorting domain-containing protein [Paraglaciecola sp. MB-3u-78]PKG95957.1 hypothetical protein CXF95_25145 [Paraglaciecola sp. MB-3u-78]